MGLSAGPVPTRVTAEVKAGLLDLVDHAAGAGWSQRRACRLLDLDEDRATAWQRRRREDGLEGLVDQAPGGGAVHGLLDSEREAIVELFEAWGGIDRSHRKLAHRGSRLCLVHVSESTVRRVLADHGLILPGPAPREPAEKKPWPDWLEWKPNRIWGYDFDGETRTVDVHVRTLRQKLGECGLSFFATPALAQRLEGPFPACLQDAPLLVPGQETVVRSRLQRWFAEQQIQPQIVGEFDDSALMKAFGQAGADFGDLLLQVVNDFQRVLAVAGHRDAGDHLALAIELGHATALIRYQFNTGNVTDQHRCAFFRLDDQALDVGHPAQIALATHHVLGFGHLHHAPADVAVRVAHHLGDLGQGNAVSPQFHRIDGDLVGLHKPAHRRHFGHAMGLGQLVAQVPVLQATQFGQGHIFGQERILVHPAHTSRIRADLRCHTLGHAPRCEVEVFEHA